MAENAEAAKQTGGMIALLPADPAALVVDTPNGEPAEDMHVTLQFLGSDVSSWDATRRQHLLDAARLAVAELDGPVEAAVVGHATFAPGQDAQCAVYLVGDTAELDPLHVAITAACAEVLGDDHHTQHAPFLPHATAGYGLAAADLTYTGPVLLDRLLVVLAGERTEIPIPDRLAEIAREAYAHGWALSGGPMTDRVRAGCLVAIANLREHRHDPGIVEATIDLGSLEGTWAAVYQRREQLYADHIAAVTKAWRALIALVDVGAAVAKFRTATVGLREAASDDQADQQAAAQAQARSLLHSIVEPAAPEYQALVDAVANALRDAEAEGQAGAIAITADQAGMAGISFDLAVSDAHAALGTLDAYWGEAGDWIGKVVNGAAADLGDALARVASAGGTYEELMAAAGDVLDGSSVRAIDTLVDMAMSQSFSRGAIALYQREGVQTVDYLTAGGPRVCPVCLAAEAKNPWPIAQVPQPALHPFCRCTIASSDPLEALRTVDLSRYAK